MLPLFLAQPRDVLHRTYHTRCEKKASNPSDNASWNGIEGHLWGCCNVIGGGRSPPQGLRVHMETAKWAEKRGHGFSLLLAGSI